jgi:tetratricopeptide (TPR) repeat protein
MPRFDARTTAAALLVAAGLCLSVPLLAIPACQSEVAAERTPAATTTPTLYDGFGGYHRQVSTESAEAQQWFDQGLQLLYGFNHDEAIRSFQHAAEIDPDLAMAHWGEAYAHGLHINNPVMGQAQSEQAYAAAQDALAKIDHASPVEAALIRAVVHRYEMPVPEDRAHLDEAYAAAMEQVWAQYPNDADVGALFAESLMNLQPWDLWEKDGTPKGRTLEIVATLERVLEINEQHPGANHFYIHTVEASNEPQRAVAAADRLQTLVPGSGHLVHMPAHIYARVGRWQDASDANVRAIAADRAYFEKAPEPDFYALYFIHNIHFLSWSAMMEGRYETAIDAARELERDIPQGFLKEWTFIADGFMPVVYHAMLRFGKWEDILAEEEPEDYRRLSLSLWHYARGIALANTDRVSQAREELAAFEAVAATVPEDWVVGNSAAADVLDVARHMLKGEIAYKSGNPEEAFVLLRKGVELEDTLSYDEPPDWMQPVRHALGALLLAEGRHDEAKAVYLEDLTKYPENGWALLGLSKAMEAAGEDTTAVDARRARVWTRNDVRPVASCYCHPDAG